MLLGTEKEALTICMFRLPVSDLMEKEITVTLSGSHSTGSLVVIGIVEQTAVTMLAL
jgi:hypothetical protein